MLSETLGNKRLGDNVITGLERLLPYLAKVENGVLLKAFPESRLDSDRGMKASHEHTKRKYRGRGI